MNEEMEMIDQSALAESVAEKVNYQFLDYFLVKPLDPIKVKKEFNKPVPTGTPAKNEDGLDIQDYEDVETEVKEVNSDYRKGIVIKRPLYYGTNDPDNQKLADVNIGDVVIFREAAGLRFDLLKDSRLLRLYDILGVEK